MVIDYNKIGVIGVDRIVINNFKLLNFDKLEKKEIINKLETLQRYEIRNDLFHLIYTEVFRVDGTEYDFATLEFNPSKIKYGHNIYNASEVEVCSCLEEITKTLAAAGIEIDLSEAKIREVEINVTIDLAYEKLSEVVLLILKANHTRAIGVYSILPTAHIPYKIKQDRCIYINNNRAETNETTGKIIKIYDKTFEMERQHDINIERDLTRVEVLFGREYYRRITERLGLDNNLTTFLSSGIMQQLFTKAIENEVKEKPIRELDKIKTVLETAFVNFRRTESFKRSERIRLKKANRDIPKHLKEERGVFEYLKRESWIFDYTFLYEIVSKNVPTNHQADYEKQIIKKYLNIKNKQLFNSFLELIFLPTNIT